MILSNLRDEWRNEQSGSWRRVSMDIRWEDCEVEPQQLYFEAQGTTAELFQPNPNGFAIAGLPLAAWRHERRLQVEGTLCTRLRGGLRVLNKAFHGWFPEVPLLDIEPTGGYTPTRPTQKARTAALFSGGVDGFAALRRNRLDYPLDHPDSIAACIVLYGVNGFDFDANGPRPARMVAFDQLVTRLRDLARAEHFELHPVYTNVRSLAPSYRYWHRIGFGAGHVAVGQLFQGSFDKLLLASDGDGYNPPPGAVHPLFNHQFSTASLRIEGVDDEITRLEKIRLLVDWEPARRLMQPCHRAPLPQPGPINCGRCEKCVRTMLTLIGLGRLAKVSAFTEDDIGPARVLRIPVHNARKAKMLGQPVEMLRKSGRSDLVWAIRLRLLAYHLLRR